MSVSKKLDCCCVAVFSDIHSNFPAFRACYEDALRCGANGFLFLGDFISDLADVRGTLDLVYEIRERFPTVCLRGNREGYMLDCRDGRTRFAPGSKTGSLLYTYGQLTARDLDFITGLPIYDTVEICGVPFELAHAVRDNDRYYFDTQDGKLDTVFPQMDGPWLLTGHSHKQYIRSRGGKTILNPGSIGVPRGFGNQTMYALLHVRNGTVAHELRHLPYDIPAAIHAQFASGLVTQAKFWAIGILYDVITGEECTLTLLKQVLQQAGDDPAAIHDEALWHHTAEQMGMEFTEQAILNRLAHYT